MISLTFSAKAWQRCRKHTPSVELSQFLLALPDQCSDRKLSLKLDLTGLETSRFDLNTMMYELDRYKPDFTFKQVDIYGSADLTLTTVAEGLDTLFTKCQRLSVNNLSLKTVAFHKVLQPLKL